MNFIGGKIGKQTKRRSEMYTKFVNSYKITEKK